MVEAQRRRVGNPFEPSPRLKSLLMGVLEVFEQIEISVWNR